jgi:hypothetical protein
MLMIYIREVFPRAPGSTDLVIMCIGYYVYYVAEKKNENAEMCPRIHNF